MTAKDTYDVLRKLVEGDSKTPGVRCKPGWTFRIVDEDGALRLVIRIDGHDNYNPDKPFSVNHFHPVPAGVTYNEATWKRWIFEQCRRTMNHELGETVRWGEDRPFAPCHGPGEDPYTVHEYRPEADAFTTQDGSLRARS
jgi:hypothetical protein